MTTLAPDVEASPLAGRLVFVVGAPRSGTNWIQRIITSHPEAVAVPTETYLFSHGLGPLSDRIQHAAPGSVGLGAIYMDRRRFLVAARRFCDEVFGGLLEVLDPDARLLVERTPIHTTCLDLIGALYPDAAVVHIVRDGRDVARSQLSTGWGPDNVREAAAEWRRYVESARADAGAFATYLEVGYEQLLADPPAVVATVFAALGLEADEEAVNRAVREADVPYNVDPKMPAIGVGKWREVFGPDELAAFDEAAGETLALLGYGDADADADTGTGIAAPSPAASAPRPSTAPAPAQTTTTTTAPSRGVRRAAQMSRSVAARLARKLGGDQAAAESDGLFDGLMVGQQLCDRLLGAVAERRWHQIDELLDPLALVGVEAAGERWTERGQDAVRRLVAHLEADEALGGRQLRGDVHPGMPTTVVISTYLLDDGRTLDRAWFASVDKQRITRLVHYAFPLGRR